MSVTVLFLSAVLLAGPPTSASSSSRDAATPGKAHVKHCIVTLIDHVQVPASEPGVLTDLMAKEGMMVEQGDLLANVDKRDAQARKRAAEAEVAVAKKQAENDAEVESASKTAGVLEQEYRQNLLINQRSGGKAISEFEVRRLLLQWERAKLQTDVARLEQEVAKLTSGAKQAQADVVENELRRRTITSPISGEIVFVNKHAGEWCQPGELICRVVRMDRLKIEGFVEANRHTPQDVVNRQVDIVVKITNDLNEKLKGKITYASPIVESSGEFRIWVEVENRRANNSWILRPGLNADMTIDIERRVAAK